MQQIAKDFNAAFSDDKLREQWLKRILPGLVVTVIYFVFVSNILRDKADKAESAYRLMVSKGVTDQALPTLQQQYGQIQTALADLKQKDLEVQQSLAGKAGFLFGKNDEVETVDRISQLMRKHHLMVSDEKTLNDLKISELPRSVANLKQWLNDAVKSNDTIKIHRIEFLGAYANVYAALRELALGDFKVLPVFLSMRDVPEDDAAPGLKAWVLDLWV